MVDEYLTDEQQAEVVKRWLRQNGLFMVLGVVLGLGGLFGWNSWQDRQEAIRSGIPEDSIEMYPSPSAATAEALAKARPGDLLVLLALTQRDETLALVHEFMEAEPVSHG